MTWKTLGKFKFCAFTLSLDRICCSLQWLTVSTFGSSSRLKPRHISSLLQEPRREGGTSRNRNTTDWRPTDGRRWPSLPLSHCNDSMVGSAFTGRPLEDRLGEDNHPWYRVPVSVNVPSDFVVYRPLSDSVGRRSSSLPHGEIVDSWSLERKVRITRLNSV